MIDSGFAVSFRAVERQLAAMPSMLYLIRLIHYPSRRAFPGERIWTAPQILKEATLRFLRARNREGFDVYFRPYANLQNAGYILVDLDDSPPATLSLMLAHGHEPCVTVETSPGHFQAWIRVSAQPLAPVMATSVARHLALLYHGDRASADWRHVGRLAGFTNQKPQRRLPNGGPPWVRIRDARLGLASRGGDLLNAALCPAPQPDTVGQMGPPADGTPGEALDARMAVAVYRILLCHFRIPQRFPCPDWSIADLWIAKALLAHGMPNTAVKSILRLASPQFPRSHSHPEDYLRRTLARAVRDLAASDSPVFPARAFAPPAP